MTTLPNLEKAIAQLIAIPSISSTDNSWDQSNREVINLLADWFSTLGFHISTQLVPLTNNKFNMLAKLGDGEGGLLLAGHSDTVPFDENQWHSDPFKLTVRDNKFYGLGSCDMKSFFAFILQACHSLSKNNMKKPLYILATADEETTMAGARFFTQTQDIRPDVAVIGEPTNIVPVVMHKGHMSYKINVKGKSGHSSQPAFGINAIEIMYQVIDKLIRLKKKLALNYLNEAFDVQEPTLNLGAIKGGDNANRICGHCSLDIDMRALPGIKEEELITWLHESLKPLVDKYPARISIKALHPGVPSFKQNKNTSLVTFAEKISCHQCCAVNYATEAPFIQRLGCQTIVMGPGSIEQAHQPNEYLSFNEINKTSSMLSDLINQYCY